MSIGGRMLPRGTRHRKPPYTESGLPEPDFLTPAQHRKHDRMYQLGETSWSKPFKPWVVRSWCQHLDQIGGFEVADRIRKNLAEAIHIANDRFLTAEQAERKIRDISKPASRYGRKRSLRG